MRKIAAAMTLLLAFSMLAGQIARAKPGHGNGGGGSNQSAVPSSISLASYSDLRLGGTVGFDTDAEGLAGWEYPIVAVRCYQDLNGDGLVNVDRTWNEDGVYAELRTANEDFVL